MMIDDSKCLSEIKPENHGQGTMTQKIKRNMGIWDNGKKRVYLI